MHASKIYVVCYFLSSHKLLMLAIF